VSESATLSEMQSELLWEPQLAQPLERQSEMQSVQQSVLLLVLQSVTQ